MAEEKGVRTTIYLPASAVADLEEIRTEYLKYELTATTSGLLARALREAKTNVKAHPFAQEFDRIEDRCEVLNKALDAIQRRGFDPDMIADLIAKAASLMALLKNIEHRLQAAASSGHRSEDLERCAPAEELLRRFMTRCWTTNAQPRRRK